MLGVEKKYPDFGEKFKDVRLLSCHGADGGANSYARKLADLLNKPVKANEGVMWAYGPLNVIENSPSKSARLRITKKTNTYEDISYKYRPRTFIPNIRNA